MLKYIIIIIVFVRSECIVNVIVLLVMTLYDDH